ncbi:MAG: DUF3108 domain-containing protein [Elusimicrobiota bacterium]
MIKHGLLALLLLASAAGEAAAEGTRSVYSSATINSPYDLIRGTMPRSQDYTRVPWFGEQLKYEVKWGVVMLGHATLGVPEVVDFAGQPAYHVVNTAKTIPFADKFYEVRDLNESWIHVGDLRSLGYSKKLREGNFFRDEWVLYDYHNKFWLSKQVNRDATFHYSSGAIPGEVQDLLSSIFLLRPEPLKVGDEISFDVNTKKTWPLKVKVLRRQTVSVPAGRFRCVVLEPFLRDEGLFVQKGRKLQIWVTDDERHIPVLMKVDIILGKISAYLLEINGEQQKQRKNKRRW